MDDSYVSDNENTLSSHLDDPANGKPKPEGSGNRDDQAKKYSTVGSEGVGNAYLTGSKSNDDSVGDEAGTKAASGTKLTSQPQQDGRSPPSENGGNDPPESPEENRKFARNLIGVIVISILCALVYQELRFNDIMTDLEKFKQTHSEEMIVANVKMKELFSLTIEQKREINRLQEDLMISNSKIQMVSSKITELERLYATQKNSDSRGEWLWDSLDYTETPPSSQGYKTEPGRSKPENTAINMGAAITAFRNSLNTLMESEFRSQSSDTRVQLLSSVASTMTELDPTRPSAVLFLSPPSLDPSFGLCFAKKVATIVNNAFEKDHKGGGEPKVLNTDYFRKMTVLSIHEDLKNYLDFKGKAVVVSNLAEIQEEPLLMTLHAFCENSHSLAYDSRANFFSVLTVPEEVYKANEWTHWQGKYIAKESLDTVWKTALDDDKRGALISRVASSVILLQPGDTC